MIDEELKAHLEAINRNVYSVNAKLAGKWNAFVRGILTGFGSVLGAFIAVAIIGYILNLVGIIPSLKSEVDSWKNILQQTQNAQNILQRNNR
jgi:hypothetical protein